jgi:hypothetical protein
MARKYPARHFWVPEMARSGVARHFFGARVTLRRLIRCFHRGFGADEPHGFSSRDRTEFRDGRDAWPGSAGRIIAARRDAALRDRCTPPLPNGRIFLRATDRRTVAQSVADLVCELS